MQAHCVSGGHVSPPLRCMTVNWVDEWIDGACMKRRNNGQADAQSQMGALVARILK